MDEAMDRLTPRQRSLFEKLLQDILANGFSHFTIERAVRENHCSKSTIYALGENREEILRALLISFFREVACNTQPLFEEDGVELLCVEVLENYFSSIAKALESASAEFMCDLAREPVAQEIFTVNTQAAVRVVTDLLHRGIEEGEFSIESVDFASQLIHRSLMDIQQGYYERVLPTSRAYMVFGQLIINGLAR